MITFSKRVISKKLMLNILLGIILPILLTLTLLHPLLIQEGIPFYGDEMYYGCNLKSFHFNIFNLFYAWITGLGPTPPTLTFFSYSLPLTLMIFIFGQEIAVKLFILIVAVLPGILTFFAFEIIAKEWSLFEDEKEIIAFATISSLFMLLSFTNAGLIGAATAPSWAYATLSFLFAIFIKYLRTGKIKYLICFGILSIFAVVNPFWIYLIIIVGFIYIIFEITTLDISIIIKRIMSLFLIFFGFNAFWIIQSLSAYILGCGGYYGAYSTEKLITLESLRFLSHWNLLDVIMIGEHEYYFFWHHPQNYGPLNVTVPIVAAASILIFRRNRYVLFMGLILVIGVFSTKGIHEPCGYLYYLIAKNLPYGAGAILRNPCKFVPLVTFSYAFLVGLFITKIYKKISCKPTLKYGSTIVLSLLILLPITYGTLLDLQSYTWIRYKPTYVPQAYDNINNWLLNQSDDFKVMWIPSGGSYVWKPYIITNFPDTLSSKPTIPFKKIYPEPLNSTDNIGRLLASLGVKYVIYHGDSLSYPNKKILKNLMIQKDLKAVYLFNYTYIPEDNSKNPLPTGASNVQFSNVPVKLLKPDKLLRGGETELLLYYQIPQEVVKKGYKGKFWAGFSMRLHVFPAGKINIHERIYEAFVEEQKMINDTCGYVIFKVEIPKSYRGSAVDIYVDFYDNNFKKLTPLYFVGRLLVYPTGIVCPFIIFENIKYKGQIYTNISEAKILSYKPDSPVKWEVNINASKPFILIFTEPYDRLWCAYVNNKEIKSIPTDNLVNSFSINETGNLTIVIRYKLQDWFELGWKITGLAFVGCIGFLFYDWRRGRGDKWVKEVERRLNEIKRRWKNKV